MIITLTLHLRVPNVETKACRTFCSLGFSFEGLDYSVGHHLAMNFIGTVVNPGRTGIAIEHLKRSVFGITQCPMDLDRAINHVVQDSRTKEFDYRNLDSRVVTSIQFPGGV